MSQTILGDVRWMRPVYRSFPRSYYAYFQVLEARPRVLSNFMRVNMGAGVRSATKDEG